MELGAEKEKRKTEKKKKKQKEKKSEKKKNIIKGWVQKGITAGNEAAKFGEVYLYEHRTSKKASARLREGSDRVRAARYTAPHPLHWWSTYRSTYIFMDGGITTILLRQSYDR